ncbi:MAG: hypothetical protein LBR80_14910 [Deltaproteobacteria bacterium]|jgi:hypothetical protein|nr:hypothetical protein [Deltaproteobacteria bacterium]
MDIINSVQTLAAGTWPGRQDTSETKTLIFERFARTSASRADIGVSLSGAGRLAEFLPEESRKPGDYRRLNRRIVQDVRRKPGQWFAFGCWKG